MSAYDNPTIIRDESAAMWSQGIASFGENFLKARALRDDKLLKEKEEQRKLKKESDEIIINQQVIKTNQATKNQKEIGDAVNKISTVDIVLQEKAKSNLAALYTRVGENNAKAATEVQDAEVINSNAKYSEQVNQYKDNSIGWLTKMQTNVTDYADMGPYDQTSVAWHGNTGLDRLINQTTCYASDPNNFSYRDKVKKDLTYNQDDPSDTTLDIQTNIGDRAELKKQLKLQYANSVTDEQLETEVNDGIKNGYIIDDGSGNLSLKFNQKLGQATWDGTFFTKVPNGSKGEEWSKDQGNIIDPETKEPFKQYWVNAGAPEFSVVNAKGMGKGREGLVTTKYLNTKLIQDNTKVFYDARAESLLNSDLKDPTVYQSFIKLRLKQGSMSLADFTNKYKTPEEQKKFISDKLFELDLDDKLSNYNSRPATKEDVEAKRAKIEKVDTVWYQKSEPNIVAKKEEATNELTAQQKLNKAKLDAGVKKVNNWLKDPNDTSSQPSPDGSVNLFYDPATKMWKVQRMTSGGLYEGSSTDTAYPDKATAAEKYF